MNKVRYTDKQDEWLKQNYEKTSTYEELTNLFNETFGTSKKKSQIGERCSKRLKLKGRPNITSYGIKQREELPIGTIRKSQTATFIKVLNSKNAHSSGYAEPYWKPLQKKIYEDAYGKIKEGQMVCFLDGNTENFDVSNLYCIDRKISVIMSQNRWWSKQKENTLTAIKWCELWYALKEV